MPIVNHWITDLIADFSQRGEVYSLASEGYARFGQGAIVIHAISRYRFTAYYSTPKEVEESDLHPDRKQSLLQAIQDYDPDRFAVVCCIAWLGSPGDEHSEEVVTLVRWAR